MYVLNPVRLFVNIRRNSYITISLYSIGKVYCKEQSLAKNMEKKLFTGTKRVENIIKSAEDKRSYRGLELENYMKVLLISDPLTDKSAAALDVNIGFLNDPNELPGLAHFCEHMLFLGTEKYPNENDYNKFLSEHGGSSNATTFPDHTTFFFDILPDQLFNALDRFSQFFIAPLFTESMTEREINAVNSEHNKNLQSDVWRMDQLDKHTANSDHPYHKFGSGNKETLSVVPKEKGINVRDELLKFHGEWYSANIMGLVILGKECLDELEEIAVKLFSKVKNRDVEAPRWEEHPYKGDNLGTRAYIVPVKDIRSVNIIFPSPDLHEYYKSGPGHYISHLMGHEGPGSILSVLKARGWSNNLVAGNRPAPRGLGFFGVSVDLTEEGMNHIDDIVRLIFQHLNLLKKEGPLKWVQDEQRDIYAMTFRFKDKESPRSYVSSIVHNMHEFPLEEVLSGNYLLSDWRPDIVENLFENFVPENVRVAVIAKKFESIANDKEPWYGTQYKMEKLPQEILKSWKDAGLCESLRMPDKNEFIPSDFSIYPLDKDVRVESTEYPQIIQDTALTRVWFKQDDKFLLPKANLIFDFVSPLAYLDPLNCNLTHMFVQLFRDSLNEYAYSAELAGLKWDLTNTKYGLILTIEGFNDKQHIFLDKVMEKLVNFKVDPKRFEIYKENYIRALKNFAAEQPYQHAVYNLAVLLTEHSWIKEELLSATEKLSIEQLESFIPQVLSKMHVECLIHGNANKEKAKEVVYLVESHLLNSVNVCPLLPRQLLLNRELKLEAGSNYLYEVKNKIHKTSCIELYYQCGLQSKENNMMLELIAQIVQEPCFNILRTQEQLGYIVFSGIRRSNGVQGLRVIVQSDRHPRYLDSRIENFLTNMRKEISDMSEEEFERHKEALAAQRLEKPKQLSVQTQMYWSEITKQQYHFDRANVEVAFLRTLTKRDILKFYNEMLVEMRKKIGVHVVSETGEATNEIGEEEDVEKEGHCVVIDDVTVFKSMHEMHPLVQPYINIPRKGNRCKL